MFYRILSINFWKKKFFFSEGILRKIDKKTCHFEQILAIKAVGLGEGGESVKKRKAWDENLFQIMLNKILESCKNDICWYKNWCKPRNKKTGSCVL